MVDQQVDSQIQGFFAGRQIVRTQVLNNDAVHDGQAQARNCCDVCLGNTAAVELAYCVNQLFDIALVLHFGDFT